MSDSIVQSLGVIVTVIGSFIGIGALLFPYLVMVGGKNRRDKVFWLVFIVGGTLFCGMVEPAFGGTFYGVMLFLAFVLR